MGMFDFVNNLDFSDPQTMARLGALQGLGQAAATTKAPTAIGAALASMYGGAGEGARQAQQYKAGQMGLAVNNLQVQQTLAKLNFFRQLGGQKPITIQDVMSGNINLAGPQGSPGAAPIPGQPNGSPQPLSGPAKVPEQTATAPGQSGFDDYYTKFLAPHEGGYNANDGNGAPVNFGINAKANPDVNVKTLKPEEAKKLTLDRYWTPSGADKLDPALAAVHGDTAFIMGPQAANTLLQEAGGDPQKYLALREQKFKAIAAANPDKAQYLPTWLKRNADLSTYVQGLGGQQAQPGAQAAPAQEQPNEAGFTPSMLAQYGQADPDAAMGMMMKQQRIIPPAEAEQLGFRPGAVVSQDVTGNYHVEQPGTQQFIAATPEDKKKYGATLLGFDPAGRPAFAPSGTEFDMPSADLVAEKIAHYEMQPISAMAQRTPYGQYVMSKAVEINPKFDQRYYNSSNKAVTLFGAGAQGDKVKTFNVAIQHLGVLRQAITALNNGDVQGLNQFKNWWQTQTGQPAPTTFEGIRDIVGDELTKAILGGAGALGDRQALQQTFNKAGSPEQLTRMTDRYVNLMTGQLVGLRKQFTDSTKLPESVFEQKLLPETIAALEKHQGGAGPTGGGFDISQADKTATGPKSKANPNGIKIYHVNGSWYTADGKPWKSP